MCRRLELATGRVLRPSVPDDAPRLVALFERCSRASRYGRFLAPLRHFPAAHLVEVVRSSPVRRSWVVDDLESGHLIAVASWFRNHVHRADVGLLVEDEHQRQGHGTALLDEVVVSARNAGITTLVATTLADARHVHRMLRGIGPTCIRCAGHTCELHVALG